MSESEDSEGSDDPGEPAGAGEFPEEAGYGRGPVWLAAFVGLVVAAMSVQWASGGAPFYEEVFRVAPTVADGGVGADWVAGNTVPALDFLIALVHAADVLMGLFILLMVFVHWASFRRLAARMRRPAGAEEAVAADGGEVDD